MPPHEQFRFNQDVVLTGVVVAASYGAPNEFAEVTQRITELQRRGRNRFTAGTIHTVLDFQGVFAFAAK